MLTSGVAGSRGPDVGTRPRPSVSMSVSGLCFPVCSPPSLKAHSGSWLREKLRLARKSGTHTPGPDPVPNPGAAHTEAKRGWFWGAPYRGHVGSWKGAGLRPRVSTGFVGRGPSSFLGKAPGPVA